MDDTQNGSRSRVARVCVDQWPTAPLIGERTDHPVGLRSDSAPQRPAGHDLVPNSRVKHRRGQDRRENH